MLAFALAAAIEPLVSRLCRKGVKREIAAGLCVLIALAALTAGLLMAMIPMGALAEDELFFSPNDPVQERDENDEEKSELDKLKDMNAAIMEALGKKDWEALAKKVSLTGDWRTDLVKLAESQLGYQEEKDGMTLYTRWAGLEKEAEEKKVRYSIEQL